MISAEWSLERYRPLLCLHVHQLRLGRLYRARFDTSDVVQDSLARALKAKDQLRGRSEVEVVAWLRTIVGNVLVDLVREHGAAKRDPRLEQTIGLATGEDDTPLAAYLSASEPSPTSLVGRKEELLRLAGAMDQLPEAERDAVIAHFILGLPLAEVAIRLGRSEKGVAGLLFRGKQRLRKLLAALEDSA